jgi:hypothetical protein
MEVGFMSALTIEQFQEALPEKMKRSVNKEVIDSINKVLADPDFYEQYRDNLLSYTKVMQEGKFKISQYVDAVKYVAYKHMGLTNRDAYAKTFPEKIMRFMVQGVSDKDIASYSTAYNKSKLVTLLYEQTLIPTHILNQDLFQKALNVQAELMVSANSEKVRSDAANSLINALKPPETKKVQLDVGVREDQSIQALREATMALAAQQRAALQSGASNAQQVAEAKIIQGERLA